MSPLLHTHKFAMAACGSLALLILLAALPFVLTGCGDAPLSAMTNSDSQQTRSASQSEARVETVDVELQDIDVTVRMPGTVEGYETVPLFAKVGGFLKDIAVDIGDPIEEGQVLATLDIPEMQQELLQKQALVEQAQAEEEQAFQAIKQQQAEVDSTDALLEEAKAEREEKVAGLAYRRAELDRMQSLVDSRSARRELLDAADFRYKEAQAGLKTVAFRVKTAEKKRDAAIAQLEKSKADHKAAGARVKVARANENHVSTMMQYATIKAPFNGRVVKRLVDPDAFVQPAEGNSGAQPLLIVTRTDMVRIKLDVPMNDVRLLDIGDRAVLDQVNVLPNSKPFVGEVSRTSAALNMSSRLMRVEIDLKNEDGRLRPGYYGYVTIQLSELRQTPVVPSSALLVSDEGPYVCVINDGVCHRRPINIVHRDGTIVGVRPGDLQAGEKVVRAGGGHLGEGEKVATQVAAK